jgi:hypothetical protein
VTEAVKPRCRLALLSAAGAVQSIEREKERFRSDVEILRRKKSILSILIKYYNDYYTSKI